jgi:hypothetical protein
MSWPGTSSEVSLVAFSTALVTAYSSLVRGQQGIVESVRWPGHRRCVRRSRPTRGARPGNRSRPGAHARREGRARDPAAMERRGGPAHLRAGRAATGDRSATTPVVHGRLCHGRRQRTPLRPPVWHAPARASGSFDCPPKDWHEPRASPLAATPSPSTRRPPGVQATPSGDLSQPIDLISICRPAAACRKGPAVTACPADQVMEEQR